MLYCMSFSWGPLNPFKFFPCIHATLPATPYLPIRYMKTDNESLMRY